MQKNPKAAKATIAVILAIPSMPSIKLKKLDVPLINKTKKNHKKEILEKADNSAKKQARTRLKKIQVLGIEKKVAHLKVLIFFLFP